MRTHFQHEIRRESERLARLRRKARELEQELADVAAAPAPAGQAGPPSAWDAVPAPSWDPAQGWSGQPAAGFAAGGEPAHDEAPPDGPAPAGAAPGPGSGGPGSGGPESGGPESADPRTDNLLRHGRISAYRPAASRRRLLAAAAAGVAVLAIVLAVLASGSGSWPSSVATVRREEAKACQNPNVKSEPGQVDFACAPATRQILWVFALLTSDDNPRFADTSTGRLGLEPIAPQQGGTLAWSLNLHHPYNPFDAVDSLQVAARAINNIVGGATVAGPGGKPVVEPGLESSPANCSRYTGSAAITVRQGYPALCARPVTSPAGRAALVSDIFGRWIVGASPRAARDAAILFGNAKNPGNPQVQAILGHVPVWRP